MSNRKWEKIQNLKNKPVITIKKGEPVTGNLKTHNKKLGKKKKCRCLHEERGKQKQKRRGKQGREW